MMRDEREKGKEREVVWYLVVFEMFLFGQAIYKKHHDCCRFLSFGLLANVNSTNGCQRCPTVFCHDPEIPFVPSLGYRPS